MYTFTEAMERARASAVFARNDLRGALVGASAMQSLLLLPLIERAALLARDIKAVIDAHTSDAEEK
jgi:hypothetical protein